MGRSSTGSGGPRASSSGAPVARPASISPHIPTVPKESAQAFAKHAAERDSEMFKIQKSLGVTSEQAETILRKNIERMVGSADVATRVPVVELPRILSEGRMKSQFETGTSKGLLSPTVRAKTEEKFGVPKDIAPEKRPIYGYLTADGKGHNVGGYGNAAIIFHESVKERTTFTSADSLDHTHFGMPFLPTPVSAPSLHGVKAEHLSSVVGKRQNIDAFQRKTGHYVEAQIYGGVDISSRTVKQILFFGGPPGKDLKKQLRSKRIRYKTLPQ